MHFFLRSINRPSGRRRLGAGRIYFARTFQSPKGRATNGSETQEKMRLVETSRIFFWRSRRDSNPRAAFDDNTISSRARYDHFDTTPYSVPAAASSRLAQVLLCDSDMYYNRYSPFVKYFFKISFYFFRPAQHLGKAVPYWADRVNKKASKQGFRSKNLFDKAAGLNLICPPLPCLDASFYSGHSSPSQRPMKS